MTAKKKEAGPRLSFTQPAPDPHINVLLYGPPKSGKTVGAATAPGPILYLNADRPNATRMAHLLNGEKVKEAKLEGLETLIAASQAVSGGKYATVVLDPIGEAYRVLLEEASGRAIRPKINEYGDTGVHLERFCRLLCEEPVNAVFVLHETSMKDEESGSFERLPYTGTNNPALAAKLMAMVDVIGYTGVVQDEDGSNHYLAQLINARGRRGGDRFGVLGGSREVNLTEWLALAKQTTKEEAAA